jgi:hypothetical protein
MPPVGVARVAGEARGGGCLNASPGREARRRVMLSLYRTSASAVRPVPSGVGHGLVVGDLIS